MRITVVDMAENTLLEVFEAEDPQTVLAFLHENPEWAQRLNGYTWFVTSFGTWPFHVLARGLV